MQSLAFSLIAASLVAAGRLSHDKRTHTCQPGTAWCAGDSLGTDIIIRCNRQGKEKARRCSDELAGQPPQGLYPALCWQQDSHSGIAACAKNVSLFFFNICHWFGKVVGD